MDHANVTRPRDEPEQAGEGGRAIARHQGDGRPRIGTAGIEEVFNPSATLPHFLPADPALIIFHALAPGLGPTP